MAVFPISGHWWLPETPDSIASGTVEQDHNGTLTLRTIGGLQRDDANGDPVRIFGESGTRPITLLDATLTDERAVSAADDARHMSTTSQTWRCPTAVIGGHVGEEKKLYGVAIESYWFDAWLDIEIWRSRLGEGSFLAMSDEPDSHEHTDYAGGRLQVNVGWTTQAQQRTWSIARKTNVTIAPKDPISLAQCREHVEHLDALTALVLQRRTGPARVDVFPDDEWRTRRRWALVGTIAAPWHAEPQSRLATSDALASYQDLGAIDALAGWYSLSPDYTYLAGRIASHHRADERFPEDRALAAFGVGEALDRIESGIARDWARNRWQRLADATPQFANTFLDRPLEDWLTLLLARRNDLAHTLTTIAGDRAATAHLDAITTSAHMLATLTIMRQAGLHHGLDIIAGNPKWTWIAEVFSELVTKAD